MSWIRNTKKNIKRKKNFPQKFLYAISGARTGSGATRTAVWAARAALSANSATTAGSVSIGTPIPPLTPIAWARRANMTSGWPRGSCRNNNSPSVHPHRLRLRAMRARSVRQQWRWRVEKERVEEAITTTSI